MTSINLDSGWNHGEAADARPDGRMPLRRASLRTRVTDLARGAADVFDALHRVQFAAPWACLAEEVGRG